ncbi:hypothetical protein FBU30_007362 [Linnemannia zychae]|nr:hypothetical protein FBU30_007362 [Linnemannia zychae]
MHLYMVCRLVMIVVHFRAMDMAIQHCHLEQELGVIMLLEERRLLEEEEREGLATVTIANQGLPQHMKPSYMIQHLDDISDDGGGGGGNDGVSYFGTAGQDYLLKKKRAHRSRILYWVDLIMLIFFLAMTGFVSSGSKEGEEGSPTWTWAWDRISWSLTMMAVIRILLMAFTARSRGGTSGAGGWVAGVMTLIMMFQINMIIQHRLELNTVLIAQYAMSIILTQFHWISYSAHTPISANLAYTYDPLLHDSITFSRESRYVNGNGNGAAGGVVGGGGVYSHPRPSTLRRGTSYGTMNNSTFDTVHELDEEQDGEDDDQDVFIKVNVDCKHTTHITRTRRYGTDDDNSEEDGEEAEEEEEQDMATLLAFQEQRRLKLLGVTTTAITAANISPAPLVGRSGLPPQMILNDSETPVKSPLSWAFRETADATSAATSSYNLRVAASGNSGAAAVSGATSGLTVGYGTPRRRLFKAGKRDVNGTGRRTWTGGHSIIYSGIFVDDDSSDDDRILATQNDNATKSDLTKPSDGDGNGDSERDREEEDIDANERLEKDCDTEGNDFVDSSHTHEQMLYDDTIKAEIDNSIKAEDEVAEINVDTVKVEVDDDLAKVKADPGSTVHVGIIATTTTTTTKTTQETKTSHHHRLEIEGHNNPEESLTDLAENDDLLREEAVIVEGGEPLNLSDKNDDGDISRPRLHPQLVAPEVNSDGADVVEVIDGPHVEPVKISQVPHGNIVSDGHHRGLSTLRFHISSHKDITTVICDDEDCEEHPYQEGPAAELESATGYTGRGHIVQLDIKERSSNAEERTGDGINDFEDSSDSGTILGRPDHRHFDCKEGSDEDLEILPVGTIKIYPKEKEYSRGSVEIIASEPSRKSISKESENSTSTGVITDPIMSIELETDNADVLEGEDIHRRIHIHERQERITIEEDDFGIHSGHGCNGIHGTVVIGGSKISEDDQLGGAVVVEGKNSGMILVPPRHPIPGQWVDIDDERPATGVITWGIADDIQPYTQDGVILETRPEPVVYIPPQRIAIVEPPPRPITVAVPQEPIAVVQPVSQPVVVARPTSPPVMIGPPLAPIVQMPPPQPQMIVQPQPQPVPYRLPPRAQIIQAPPAPVYRPIVQPAPVIAAPPPQFPPPQVLYQPQPRAVMPAMVAPAPIVAPTSVVAPVPMVGAPTYGTYETIVPGVVGGVGAVARGAVIGDGINGRPYSVASIYDDRSIASIHELENHNIADIGSIYEDRSVVSIDGIGIGYGPGGYVDQPYLGEAGGVSVARGRALPGMAYNRRLVSAAHIPKEATEAQHMRHAESNEYLYYENQHTADEEYRHAGIEPLERDGYKLQVNARKVIKNPHLMAATSTEESTYSSSIPDSEFRRDFSDDHMDIDSEIHVENRHAFYSSDTTRPETPYQEIQLEEGPMPLRELAIETYYDTTKSQLKVRENQGRLLSEMALQLKKQHQDQGQQQVRETIPSLPSDQVVPRASTSPALGISSPSLSLQNQHQQPPTLNIPRPPTNPPPVRLLANRGVSSSLSQARGTAVPSRTPSNRHSPVPRRRSTDMPNNEREVEDKDTEPILSTSSKNTENIMLVTRNQKRIILSTNVVSPSVATAALLSQEAASKARSLISGSVLQSNSTGVKTLERPGLSMSQNTAMHLTKTKETKNQGAATTSTAPVSARKAKRKQSVPPMSRNHLHPVQLTDGIMACWNNEFGGALEVFKEYSTIYPRWSLAAAEVHIVRQLISGQLSEADSELLDALQLSEKVGSRVFDKKTDLNYKWDCEMSFYDTLLYRGILQLTSASDTKGTFSDIKGGLQLRRAWKGYMRIKQEMDLAKERLHKLAVLAATATAEHDTSASSASTTRPVPIPIASSVPPPNSKRHPPLSSSQSSEGSRWSLFGRRGSWNQSAASLSSSPTDASELLQDGERTRSRLLSSNPSMHRGLASTLRDQAKAADELKTAVRVLEDVEDYLQYGIGLFYFIVTVVPKSLLPALRTIGLQSNHDLGIKSLEAVFARKNGRAPFAGLYLLINYLFLPRGMEDPSISLGRAGEIVTECLKSCPNGSSYLLMACHHARKTGDMIPAALNHITRGIQTCEAAAIPSINYRFELGLTFFIHQEFGKAADVFEILWRKFTSVQPISNHPTDLSTGGARGKRRKGRSNSMSQHSRQARDDSSFATNGSNSPMAMEEEEEDDFELAPFCGLCLIASKVVLRLGQEGYFEYGRDGFGYHGNDTTTTSEAASTHSGIRLTTTSGSTTPLNYPRTGPEFDLLVAAQEVLIMMAGPELIIKYSTAGTIFEHIKAGSGQSTWSLKDSAVDSNGTINSMSSVNGHPLLNPTPPAQAGKLNRFNKFAWNQCQKSLQKGRISPFLPLVILYLRRDVAYMKPALLRKYRTLLETIWKSVQHTADIDTQAIYLLLSAVVHRQLLPDDATFVYTALTDCLLLEAAIESEMWVVPYCHYELGELLYRKLNLPQAALEQFQWVVKGPGKEVRPTSVFYTTAHNSNPRLSVYGGGFPSDTVTNMVENSAIPNSGHSNHPSRTSNQRLSQLFPTGLGNPGVLGSSSSGASGFMAPPPPNPMVFYNSRYKKFEFSQSLRQRSSVCIEQIQKAIDCGVSTSVPPSRRPSLADQSQTTDTKDYIEGNGQETGYSSIKKTTKAGLTSLVNAQEQEVTGTLKRSSLQSTDPEDQIERATAAKVVKLSEEKTSSVSSE